ncbi:MAG: hypothetical protein ACXACP_14210 [Candidatus Hodarchaeales archaeon]|jgi:hypothetical protein
MKILTILGYDPTAFDLAFGEVMRITIIILAIVLHIFLIRYVYQDAHDRADPNKVQWASLVLFSNIFGLILYFYATKDLEFRVWFLSAIWMINAYIILIFGGLLVFDYGPRVVQQYMGYFILIVFLLPFILFIIGSGACTLWIGFQVTKNIFNNSEIVLSFILAVLGLVLFLVSITRESTNPYFLLPYILIIFLLYAIFVRRKV